MKKLSFLTMAIMAMTIFSCSKDEGKATVKSAVTDAKISMSFVANTDSRVATEATDDDDQVINDVSVFIFQDSGIKDVPRKYIADVTSGVPVIVDATTAAKRVYVVANIGDEAAHTAMFPGVTNEDALLALVKDRMLDLSSIAAKDVLMTGVGTVGTFTDQIAAVTVNLAFPLSKIRLVVKDNRFKNLTAAEVTADGQISIVETKVILLNAGKSIKFFSEDSGVDQGVQSSFYFGLTGTDFNQYFSNVATPDTWRDGNDNTDVSHVSANEAVTHHFYTSANNGNGAATPTILALESTKTTHVNGEILTEETYYPIQFTLADAALLEPGKSYEVTLTLNGDVSLGNGGGSPDPFVPVVDGTINVTINVATWIPVLIDKDFN